LNSRLLEVIESRTELFEESSSEGAWGLVVSKHVDHAFGDGEDGLIALRILREEVRLESRVAFLLDDLTESGIAKSFGLEAVPERLQEDRKGREAGISILMSEKGGEEREMS